MIDFQSKPKTLYGIIRRWWGDNETGQELVSRIEKWLPDELEYEEDEMGYNQGWNDCLTKIKGKLR